MGARIEGFLIYGKEKIPVDFDTDSAVCICPRYVYNTFFKHLEIEEFEEKIFDVQEKMIPQYGIIKVKVDGIESLWGSPISIPLNVTVPFLVIKDGESLVLSAKWMGEKHLNILKFMERLHKDCVREKNDEGLWLIRHIAESNLSNAEWELCKEFHNDVVGHTGEDRLKRILLKRKNFNMPLDKCRNYIRYCSHCQKMSMRWLTADNKIVIDNDLLNTIMIDVYFASDTDPAGKNTKFKYLTICDCTSRVVQIIRITGLSAVAIVVAILKASVIMPFTNVIWRSDRGTHFFAEAKELLTKLVGNRFEMSPAASHQSQATLERIHEEINRHLRPLLDCLWKIIEDPDEFMDVGVAMATGIYNRMPHSALDYNSPLDIFTPFAEQSVRLINELHDEDEVLEHEYLGKLFEYHNLLFDCALESTQNINKEYVNQKSVGRRYPLEVGDLVLVRYDPAPGAGKPQKLSTRNHGPYKIEKINGDFYDLSTITGFDKRSDIHISRLQPFYWDTRCPNTPSQVAATAERTSIVLEIVSWSILNIQDEYDIRNKLRFKVRFEDGIWDNITYDMIKQVQVFINWLRDTEGGAQVRKLLAARKRKAKSKGVKLRKEVKASVKVTWIAKPQESYMVQPDGIGLDDLDFRTQELLKNNLDDANIFSDDPRCVVEMKGIIREYIDIFTEITPRDYINLPPIKLELKSKEENDGKPRYMKGAPFRNPKSQASFDKFIKKLGGEFQGRIEEVPEDSPCPYNTPVFIKHEALDKDRMLHNSKHINDLLVDIPFYMGFTVKDIFDSLSGCGYLTMLDLQASFYQFLVHEDYRNLSAFTDPATGKRYRMKCLSMGIKNSPAIMQHLMQQMYPDEFPYIDNLGFGTKGIGVTAWTIHKQRIIKNFKICREYGLKLNLRKCIFQCGKLDYSIDCLGRLTNGTWHSIDDKTATKVRSMKRPNKVKELSSSLAKLNWLRPYVRQFGKLAAPLYQFTAVVYADKKIIWSDESMPKGNKQIQDSVLIDATLWHDLLNACANPDMLYYYEEGKQLYACGDASNLGWGFIIFMLENEELPFDDESKDSKEKLRQKRMLIAINSGSFNKEQRKWSTTDQECYAFYRGIMDNRHLLYNRPFIMITDHKNLTFLVDSESERVVRYKMALQAFTIKWVHAAGAGPTLFAPDMLSRIDVMTIP